MPAQTKKWLWSMLSHELGLEEGRTAILPASNLLVSVYNVLSEHSNKQHLIKTIATGFQVTDLSDDNELVVVRVADCRDGDRQKEYLTYLESGRSDWLVSSRFFSDNGTVTDAFLIFANEEQLSDAIDVYTADQLKQMCVGQGLKPTGSKTELRRKLKKYYKKSSKVLSFHGITTTQLHPHTFPLSRMMTWLSQPCTVVLATLKEAMIVCQVSSADITRTTTPCWTALMPSGTRFSTRCV